MGEEKLAPVNFTAKKYMINNIHCSLLYLVNIP